MSDDRPRECFTATGVPKRRFQTRSEAAQARRRYLDLFDNFDPDAKPYHCTVCNYFHLGHYGPNVRQRQRRRRAEQSAP